MPYSQVKTPSFYINILEFYNSQGIGNILPDVLRTLPVTPKPITSFVQSNVYPILSSTVFPLPSNIGKFIAILGHTLATDNIGSFRLSYNSPETYVSHSEFFNMDGAGTGKPAHNGYSIMNISTIPDDVNNLQFNLSDSDGVSWSGTSNIGSIIVGTRYTMPHSPDLSLTMTRDYEGIKTIETKGGASLSNSFYNKPPAWGNLGCWEIGNYPESKQLGASGRRAWDLSFSYLDDGDVLGLNTHWGQSVWGQFDANDYDTDDINDNGHYDFNILTDNSFYSQVIHKTQGGQIPFLFQPDKDDYTNMAICKFDQNSFRFQQTAPNLYSVSLKIREVW